MELSSISKKRKFLLFSTILGLTLGASAQSTEYCDQEKQVAKAGTTFEIFQDKSTSDGCMKVLYKRNRDGSAKNGTGSLEGKWDNIGNTLIRESRRPSNTKTNMTWSANIKKMDGNAYYGGYGWWSNGKGGNIVEFYVTDGYNTKTNATFGMTKADLRYSVDGATYDVYYSEKRGQGSVFAPSSNFLQIKAVRTSSKGKNRKSGTISWKTHFDKWRAHGQVSRSIPANLKFRRGESRSRRDRRRALEAKHRSLRKFVPRRIFEVSWLMEGFGSTSKVDFTANASFKAAKEITLDDVTETNVKIYPNPTFGEFTIENSEAIQTTISVFDLNGKLVSETITDTSEILLNSDNSLTSGLYIVRVTNAEGTTTQKLVVN